jgi:hypothetical protein
VGVVTEVPVWTEVGVLEGTDVGVTSGSLICGGQCRITPPGQKIPATTAATMVTADPIAIEPRVPNRGGCRRRRT